jgi:nucleoside 2-deoxyribosyltransferase
MIYLASPYSHPDPAVREERYVAACRAAGALMSRGEIVFSPIAHSHPIATHGGVPGDWPFWSRRDLWFVEACYYLAVLTLDGWRASAGVAAEVAHALARGKAVRYIDPVTLEESGRAPEL